MVRLSIVQAFEGNQLYQDLSGDVSLSVSQTQTVYNGVFLPEGPPDTGDFISSVSDDISRKQE